MPGHFPVQTKLSGSEVKAFSKLPKAPILLDVGFESIKIGNAHGRYKVSSSARHEYSSAETPTSADTQTLLDQFARTTASVAAQSCGLRGSSLAGAWCVDHQRQALGKLKTRTEEEISRIKGLNVTVALSDIEDTLLFLGGESTGCVWKNCPSNAETTQSAEAGYSRGG